MGDRTYVTLTVPLAHKQEVLQICKCYSSPSEEQDIGQLCVMDFEEVNYGELPFLDKLQDRGIAYDSEWEDGGSYTKGGAYLRFNKEGEAIHKELYDNCHNPDISALMQLIDDPEALRKFILAHNEWLTIPGWENQVENGKTYQVMQLIKAPAF